MKKRNLVYLGIMLISLVTTGILLALSPDKIPTHYNAEGIVDRFGSKYENLLFPATSIILGVIFMIITNLKKISESERKVIFIVGVSYLLFMLGMSMYFMIKAINYDNNINEKQLDVGKFILIGMGIILIAIGNVLPKLRMNSLIGLRCHWSMYNDVTWQKSNRYCGIVGVIIGVLMIFASIFVKNLVGLIVLVALVLIWLVVSLIGAMKVYKIEIEKGKVKKDLSE